MRFVVAAVAVSVALCVGAQAQSAGTEVLLGRNLLKNGSIEARTPDPTKPPGWTPINGLSAAEYGSQSGEWDWGVSGCTGCGKQYLRLAYDGPLQELSTSQTVDVSAAAATLDKGKTTANVSAWLGGVLAADTTSTLEVSFQDPAGKELGKLATAPVDAAKLPNPPTGSASLVSCQTSGLVPAGTRKIVFTWHAKATGSSGSYLALGDNFSLVLTAPQ